MSSRVNTQVASDLAKYGGDTATKCFNCGNCTAVCDLTDEDTTFPRKYIRFIQLGLIEKMKGSCEPWTCYYCGECNDTCPRDAEPGKMMMAARRWLTAAYDWTGISRLMYRREATEFGFLALFALIVMGLFTLPAGFGFKWLALNPQAHDTVMLHYFAPSELVHKGDIVMALLLAFFLLTNAFRMSYWVMKGSRAPFSAYIVEFKEIIIHLLTQKRWMKCEDGINRHWIRHMLLVTAYGTMFVLVVVFLPVFQVEDTGFHWTSLLGYYATLILLGVSSWMLIDRMKKREAMYKESHLSDWMFPILLFLTAFSGILLHFFRLIDWAMPTYYMYMIHLMIAVPMLCIEVPFGKWAHLLYRPLAIYFIAVKKRAALAAAREPSWATN